MSSQNYDLLRNGYIQDLVKPLRNKGLSFFFFWLFISLFIRNITKSLTGKNGKTYLVSEEEPRVREDQEDKRRRKGICLSPLRERVSQLPITETNI
jgi:hypothetical protein